MPTLVIPNKFLHIRYDGERHPQSAKFDFDQGANCQLFAYALLRHFGLTVPPYRSSELWADEEHTRVVHDFEPLDLLLFTDNETAWGAHVAVYIGDGHLIHLSKDVGLPEVCSISELLKRPKYCRLLGARRVQDR